MNGDYRIVKDLDEIDEGAFVVIKWKDLSLMIPRTFNADEISFSDGRWWWGFKKQSETSNLSKVALKVINRKGQKIVYQCNETA